MLEKLSIFFQTLANSRQILPVTGNEIIRNEVVMCKLSPTESSNSTMQNGQKMDSRT